MVTVVAESCLFIALRKENRSDGNKSNAAARYGGIPIKELVRLESGKGVTRLSWVWP